MAKKVIKMEIGTVYKKTVNGRYYFRYQINGQRKAVSLETKNIKEAISRAQELIPVVKATTTDIISAHVKHARGLIFKKKSLPLVNVWEIYSQHPERATPATVGEQIAYRTTFNEFIKFIGNPMMELADVTSELTDKFAQYMRKTQIAVSTHNRKIGHLRKIFEVLKEYRDSDNPFIFKSLYRRMREEQQHGIKRLSFTKNQEARLLEVLDDDNHKVINKPEIKVIYHLGMFTGQRLKDCVLLRWDMVDLNKKRIWIKQFKTGKEVTIPMASKLLEVLTKAQEWETDYYVCPNVARRYNTLNPEGKRIGSSLVNWDVLQVVKWIGLEPSVAVPGRKKKVTVYGFHSLRHSFASHCAEAGVPKAVVISILGTNSDIVDKHYTHIGDEAQEKAINSLFGNGNTISDREKITNALALFDKLKEKSQAIMEIEEVLREN